MNNTLAFGAFLEKWGEQYASLKNTLTRLKEHQEILDKVDIGEIYSADELDIWVKDWLWLQSKLKHPLDIDYFKPYWIPVKKHSYDYFVDLSEGNNSIFEVEYVCSTPYAWIKGFSFPTKLIINVPATKLAEIANKFLIKKEAERFNAREDFYSNRADLAYRGELDVESVTFVEVFETSIEWEENKPSITKPAINIRGKIISIIGVNVMAIGLLPFDTDLEYMVDVVEYHGEMQHTRIKCVRDMVFYLRENGYKGFFKLKAKIPGTNTEIFYKKNIIYIINLSPNLKDKFKLAFEELGNN